MRQNEFIRHQNFMNQRVEGEINIPNKLRNMDINKISSRTPITSNNFDDEPEQGVNNQIDNQDVQEEQNEISTFDDNNNDNEQENDRY